MSAEKRTIGAEKRTIGAEKRNCTLGPPYVILLVEGGGDDRKEPPAVSTPHREFSVISFNSYVCFHTHLFFSKILYGITCRKFFRDCTAVFSDMKLIFKACKPFILVGRLW